VGRAAGSSRGKLFDSSYMNRTATHYAKRVNGTASQERKHSKHTNTSTFYWRSWELRLDELEKGRINSFSSFCPKVNHTKNFSNSITSWKVGVVVDSLFMIESTPKSPLVYLKYRTRHRRFRRLWSFRFSESKEQEAISFIGSLLLFYYPN
jgi:hypothetical protein